MPASEIPTVATYLTDGNIRLRALELSDLEALYKLENDTSLWNDGVSNAPYSRELLRRYIESTTADLFSDGQLRLAICKAGCEESIGFVDLYEVDAVNRRAGVGIAVMAEYRRLGVAAAALRLMADYSRRRLGLHQLWAVTACDNEASLRLFDAAGYTKCGRLRSWLRRESAGYTDAFMWQLLLP